MAQHYLASPPHDDDTSLVGQIANDALDLVSIKLPFPGRWAQPQEAKFVDLGQGYLGHAGCQRRLVDYITTDPTPANALGHLRRQLISLTTHLSGNRNGAHPLYIHELMPGPQRPPPGGTQYQYQQNWQRHGHDAIVLRAVSGDG